MVLTECETVNQFTGSKTEPPQFTRGYGLVFGQSERKAISMSLVDRVFPENRRLGRDRTHVRGDLDPDPSPDPRGGADRSSDFGLSGAHPRTVKVEGRYVMDPSPIPKFDNPKLEMAANKLFGAGREHPIYALPPYC